MAYSILVTPTYFTEAAILIQSKIFLQCLFSGVHKLMVVRRLTSCFDMIFFRQTYESIRNSVARFLPSTTTTNPCVNLGVNYLESFVSVYSRKAGRICLEHPYNHDFISIRSHGHLNRM